jgi:hypothetical protein
MILTSLRFLFFGWLLLCLAVACTSPPNEQGIVARVNGEPIYLVQLEAKHDLKYLVGVSNYAPSLERLQDEYGLALSDLVIGVLVSQYLAKHGMTVGKAELDAVEAQVRADYPEGAFEQMLVEEYIDLDLWREQVRATLSLEKLLQKVLRPQISIDYQEVVAYYRENLVDFYLRPKVRFLHIQGPDKKLVEKVLDLAPQEEDPVALGTRFDRVDVHRYTLHEENIPQGWQPLLAGLESGQASGPLALENQSYQALVLLERTPGRLVDLVQAYPLVERILVERKLQEAFNAWLTAELETARIEVNASLLLRLREGAKAGAH